jgi:hypothetical protein
MKHLLYAAILVLLLPLLTTPALANQRYNGKCAQSGNVLTSGLSSTNTADLTYASATVTINVVGGGLATIYSDNSNTPLTNPFTANADSTFSFYAANGRYNATCSGIGVPTITFSDNLLNDPTAGATLSCANITFVPTPTFSTVNSCFFMALTGNVTSSIITGGTTGQLITFSLCQNVVGGNTFAWPASFSNPPVIDTVANHCGQFMFILGLDALWHQLSTGESGATLNLKTGTLNATSDVQANGTASTGTGGFVRTNTPTITTPAITGGTFSGNPVFSGNPNFSGNPFFTGPSPWADITAPAYGAKCDGSTDDTAALNAALTAMASTNNGGTIFIPPSASGCVIAGQVNIPNDGGSPVPKTKALRIIGAGSGGLSDPASHTCNGGSSLNMTWNATHAKILMTSYGKIEISGICFQDTASDATPFVIDVNTILHAHDNQFFGNCGDATKQDVFVLGGLGTTSGATYNNIFQGYGTEIDNNQADCIGRFALLQNQANGIQIMNNHVFIGAGNSSQGAIELSPGGSLCATLTDADFIIGNLLEVSNYKYGVNVVQNGSYHHIYANSCFDSSATTTACIRIPNSACNFGNVVIDQNPNLAGGFPSKSVVTSADTLLGASQLTLGGTVMSNVPNMQASGWVANANGMATFALWDMTNASVITSIQGACQVSSTACGVYPVVKVQDTGGHSITCSWVNGSDPSCTGLSTAMNSGLMRLSVSTAASGCGAAPASCSFNVGYIMQ